MFKYLKDRIQGKAPKGAKRSSKWSKVRKKFLQDNPLCAVCGSHVKVEVHHIIPFHVAPDLELNPENLITLCEHGRFKSINCHLLVGHFANYQRVNLQCKSDAAFWRGRLD